MSARAGAGATVALLTVAGCGLVGTSSTPSPTAIVVTPTPITVAVTLTIALKGTPTRSFIVHGGLWKVCDSGTVTNPGSVAAHDVRIVVTYVDHGVVVGHVTAADSPGDGGGVGDLAAGQARDFTVCGIASNEPDSDQVQAQAGA